MTGWYFFNGLSSTFGRKNNVPAIDALFAAVVDPAIPDHDKTD